MAKMHVAALLVVCVLKLSCTSVFADSDNSDHDEVAPVCDSDTCSVALYGYTYILYQEPLTYDSAVKQCLAQGDGQLLSVPLTDGDQEAADILCGSSKLNPRGSCWLAARRAGQCLVIDFRLNAPTSVRSCSQAYTFVCKVKGSLTILGGDSTTEGPSKVESLPAILVAPVYGTTPTYPATPVYSTTPVYPPMHGAYPPAYGGDKSHDEPSGTVTMGSPYPEEEEHDSTHMTPEKDDDDDDDDDKEEEEEDHHPSPSPAAPHVHTPGMVMPMPKPGAKPSPSPSPSPSPAPHVHTPGMVMPTPAAKPSSAPSPEHHDDKEREEAPESATEEIPESPEVYEWPDHSPHPQNQNQQSPQSSEWYDHSPHPQNDQPPEDDHNHNPSERSPSPSRARPGPTGTGQLPGEDDSKTSKLMGEDDLEYTWYPEPKTYIEAVQSCAMMGKKLAGMVPNSPEGDAVWNLCNLYNAMAQMPEFACWSGDDGSLPPLKCPFLPTLAFAAVEADCASQHTYVCV